MYQTVMYQDGQAKPTLFSRQCASRARSGNQRGIGLGSTLGSAPRRAALSVAVALVMAAGGAQATVTLGSFGDNQFGSELTASGDTSYWTDYSKHCQNVRDTGSSCLPAAPAANPAGMLFSWGTIDNPKGVNSVLSATYTGAGQTLRGITLASDASGLGPTGGPTNAGRSGPYVPATGTGSMVVYEQPNAGGTNYALDDHDASEQRFSISVKRAGATLPLDARFNDLQVLGGGPYTDPSPPDRDVVNAIVAHGFNTEFLFPTPVTLVTDDVIEVRFFESDWDNSGVGDVRGQSFPDAYYGEMQVTFGDVPTMALSVATEIDFGNVRAGDAAVPQGLTVTNSAGPTAVDLAGTFNAIVVGSDSPFYNTDLEQPLAFSSLAPTTNPLDGTTRTFEYTPGILEYEDTVAQNAEITQRVVATTPNTVNSDQTVTVKGATVGPVLGVSLGAIVSADTAPGVSVNTTDPLNPAQTLAYNQPINLGDVAIGSTLTRNLILENLFGDDLADLTTLTIFKIGKIGGDAALFTIGSGPGELLAATNGTLPISFTPDADRLFSTTLYFFTDMNNPFQVQGTCTDGVLDIAEGCIAYTLQARGFGGSGNVPTPGSLLLFMTGALSYPLFRRRRATR